MKSGFRRITHQAIFTLALLWVSIATQATPDVASFIAQVREHYEDAPEVKAFALDYHFLGNQHWDYQIADKSFSLRKVQVDLTKKHFYDNDIIHLPGGWLLDRIQFQNATESYYFERNGTLLGKRIIKEDMGNFDRFNGHMKFNIDFLAVQPLLEEQNVNDKVRLESDSHSGKTTVSHTEADGNLVKYVFATSPLQLWSIENPKRRAKFMYSDFQTTQGLTYARSVLKFYNGTQKPSYIARIDEFKLIDEVDPALLKVPQGYGPVIPESDRTLIVEQLNEALYLVTSASASQNSLFKINGDEITVFGAAHSPQVAEKTLSLIKSHFPDKQVASVFVSHPHRNQIAGLAVFVDQGIAVLADDYTIEGIKAYPPFAEKIHAFNFESITHGQKSNGAHYYVLENMLSKRQSFVYFEQGGIVFQTRLAPVAYDNTIPEVIPSYTKRFIEFINKEKLNVERVVAAYRNNDITPDVLNKIHASSL